MSNEMSKVCKKCGGHIPRGAGRAVFLDHVPMTKWYHVTCPTRSNWKSPWLTGPSSREAQLPDDFDPAYGMTEYEFLGDVGDK